MAISVTASHQSTDPQMGLKGGTGERCLIVQIFHSEVADDTSYTEVEDRCCTQEKAQASFWLSHPK